MSCTSYDVNTSRGVSYGALSWPDDSGDGEVQDSVAGHNMSCGRQREASRRYLARNKTLEVEFQNGLDDQGGGDQH
jgi:hypothetical protein